MPDAKKKPPQRHEHQSRILADQKEGESDEELERDWEEYKRRF